ELEWWGRQDVGPVTVHCVPSRHFSGRSLFDRNRRLWAGFVVEGPSRRFYHAGDTASFDGFSEIGRRLGPIDLAAMPIGAYPPRQMLAPVHATPEEAVQGRWRRARRGSRRCTGAHSIWPTSRSTSRPAAFARRLSGGAWATTAPG